MQDRITITGKRISTRQLIAARRYSTVGGGEVSEINDREVYWEYRTSLNPDGTIQSGGCHSLCDAPDADLIQVELDRDARRYVEMPITGALRQELAAS